MVDKIGGKSRAAAAKKSATSEVITGLRRGKKLIEKTRRSGPAEAVALASTLPSFDRIIHERLRLGMVTALAANESLTFSDIKRLLATTDGNLSVHARKLEEAGYVACDKSFYARVPRTEYRLTAVGRKALDQYLTEMEAFVRAARK